jgi:DNA-binding transcriptional MerR regulator
LTIAQVSEKYGLSADTLRYYERIGLIARVNRTPGGIRNYTEQDCNAVEFIKCMRAAGIPIEALIEYVSLFEQGDQTKDTRKQILIEQRDLLVKRIQEMQNTLKRLNSKIEHYDEKLSVREKELFELPNNQSEQEK